jgi:hypothetical protein
MLWLGVFGSHVGQAVGGELDLVLLIVGVKIWAEIHQL